MCGFPGISDSDIALEFWSGNAIAASEPRLSQHRGETDWQGRFVQICANDLRPELANASLDPSPDEFGKRLTSSILSLQPVPENSGFRVTE